MITAFMELLVYAFEVIKCIIVSRCVLELKERDSKKKYISLLVVTLCAITTLFTGEYSVYIDFITIAFIVYLCYEENITMIIFCIILEFMAISFVDLLMWIVMAGISPLGENYNVNENIIYFLGNLFGIAPWIMIVLFQRYKNINLRKLFNSFKLKEYVLVILVLMALMILIACTQGMFLDEMTVGGQKMVLLTSVLFSFFAVALCVLYVYVADSKSKIVEINHLNEECIKYQEEYYSSVIKKDKELRAFKHDVNKHYNALKILYKEKRFDQLGEYLDRLVDSLEINYVYHTGNIIADYIVNGKIKELENEQVHFKLIGRFPEKIKLNDTEVSVIMSNTLDNAKEAIIQYEGKEKVLEMEIRNYKDRLYITIKNSSSYRKIGVETTKNDKENHGYGLKNIERVLDNYDGSLDTSWENDIFTTEISV